MGRAVISHISSPRLPGSVTILSHYSTTALAVMAGAPLTVGSVANACSSEGAMLATTSLGTVLLDGTGGSTLEALRLPIELNEAWEASGADQPEDNTESCGEFFTWNS